MYKFHLTIGFCSALIITLVAQWANAQTGHEGNDFIITQSTGVYDHYVILRVVKVNDDWTEFEDVHGGWPAAVETKETEHLKFYEAAIWTDDNSVNLYAFDDSFDSSYQNYYDREAGEWKDRPIDERVAHREQFLVKKFDQIPAEGEAASDYLARAFEEFFAIIQQRHPTSGLGLVYSGHGSGSGGLFANSIYPKDARKMFIGVTGKLDRKLDWFDLGGPCNEGQFEVLINFAPFFQYIVASDLPNGGYSFDDWDFEKFKETKADYLYPELLGPNMDLLETMKIIQQRRRLGYEYSLNTMIRDEVEQANYIYDSEQFLKFAAAFQLALLENQAAGEARISLDTYNDVLSLVNLLNDNSLANLYEAVFLHKIDNKDFFAWNNDEHIAVNGMGYSNYGSWSRKSIIRLDLSEGGGMRWNTFQPVENSAHLVGVFPTNAPVRLEAESMSGFSFVNWAGDFSGEVSPVTIEVSEDMEISGIFHKTDEAPAPVEMAIRAGNLNQVYNGQGREISVYTDPGGLKAFVSYDGSNIPPTLPGSYPVVVTIAESGISAEATFTLNVARAGLTIGVQNASRIRGAENPEFAADYVGFVNGEGPEVLEFLPVFSTSAALESAAGEYPIVASGAAGQNYTISYESGILTIEPAPGTWPVSEFSIAGGNLWWVYSSNLPAELAVGAEIILAGTETPFDGLVCKVTEISGDWAFQIESELSWEAYPFEPSGLSGIWYFTSLGEAEAGKLLDRPSLWTGSNPDLTTGDKVDVDFNWGGEWSADDLVGLEIQLLTDLSADPIMSLMGVHDQHEYQFTLAADLGATRLFIRAVDPSNSALRSHVTALDPPGLIRVHQQGGNETLDWGDSFDIVFAQAPPAGATVHLTVGYVEEKGSDSFLIDQGATFLGDGKRTKFEFVFAEQISVQEWGDFAGRALLLDGQTWGDVELGGVPVNYGGGYAYGDTGPFSWASSGDTSQADEIVEEFGWSADLLVSNVGDDSLELTFGLAKGATDGIDVNLGEDERPPLPPSGVFEAFFQIPGTNGSLLDQRSIALESFTWSMFVQAGSGGYPVYLSWEQAIFPREGAFFLKDGITGGSFINVDMLEQDHFELKDPAITSLQIVYYSIPPCEYTYNLPAGWSMISVPCEVDDPSLERLFPDAISLFDFARVYQKTTTMEVGKGYWINLPTASIATISGTGFLDLNVDLPAGWSMLGPGQNEVPVSSLADNVISVFGFEGGYFTADALEPGRGYWANLSTAGALDLGPSAVAKQGLALPENVGAGDAVLWVEGAGRQQMLFLGVQPSEVEALPPAPPLGLFDVRVEVGGMGAWQVPRVSAPRDFRLRMQGEELQLGWQIPAAERGLWQLVIDKRIIDLDGAGRVALESGAEEVFVRQAALPQAFSLGQNFPNPFNPATTIQYSLASLGPVSLKVYDLTGQVVRQLVDQRQGRGAHQVVWDGRDEAGTPAANGVYIYELRAGTYRAWRKMLLIK